MRLLLVRHGESTWNAQGRYQGRLDPPLSQRGRAQAQALASRLQSEPFADGFKVGTIVSSPLERARDTAQACADVLALPLGTDERLTEISHGEWEGKLRGQIASRWPEMLATWRANPDLVRFPGGENLDQVRVRLDSFVRHLPAVGPMLLAVTHDVIVRIAILLAQGKPLSAFNEFQVDNAALNEFEVRNGILNAIRLNDTTHLGSLRSDAQSQAR